MTTISSGEQRLAELFSAVVEDGKVDAAEVKQMRTRLYADGRIDREEADFLFAVNDAVSGAENDAGWETLFVEAITDHVLSDEVSPGVLDEDEEAYLLGKIKADGSVDAIELQLLVNLVANAQETSESFQAFVLNSVKDAILGDGVIDAAEVQLIRKVIYAKGGGAGAGVDRLEADFLFDLNDATSGKGNHESWRALFVEAICKHLLEDEESPGVVDALEAQWLLGKIEGDGKYDENEMALIAALNERAQTLPDVLRKFL